MACRPAPNERRTARSGRRRDRSARPVAFAHAPAGQPAGREGSWRHAADGPAIRRARLERHRDAAAWRERDLVVRVGHRLLVLDRRPDLPGRPAPCGSAALTAASGALPARISRPASRASRRGRAVRLVRAVARRAVMGTSGPRGVLRSPSLDAGGRGLYPTMVPVRSGTVRSGAVRCGPTQAPRAGSISGA